MSTIRRMKKYDEQLQNKKSQLEQYEVSQLALFTL